MMHNETALALLTGSIRRISALLTLLLMPLALQAQIASGGLTGTIKEGSGAVVKGATVTLTDNASGTILTVPSTSTGTYLFHSVSPGTYTLRATADGFKTFTSNGVSIHIQQVDTIDIALETGDVVQQVTVTSAAPLLQAESAELGQTVGTKAVDDLPLNGRNWQSLAQLSAGVTTTQGGTSGGTSFVVNGSISTQNDYRLNGINDNVEMLGGGSTGLVTTVSPPPDAIEEFKLQTGDFSAEFGHSTGGVVNAVVKSGGNQIHGDLWEYIRNNAFDANDYFSKQSNIAIPEFRQNQFGFTVGGPVYIPKLYDGRNKSFFFADYQGTRIIQPAGSGATVTSVPTALMQSSGFTNLQDLNTYNSGTTADGLNRTFPTATVFDPATTRTVAAGAVDAITGLKNTTANAISVRDPFYAGGSVAGITDFTGLATQLNLIPADRIDPRMVKLLGVYPAATRAGAVNNYVTNRNQNTAVNQFDLRFDQVIGAKDTAFVVYSWQHQTIQTAGVFPGIADGQAYATGAIVNPTYAIAGGYTHIFTPTLTNELHIGFVHFFENLNATEASTMGIPGNFGIDGGPQVAGNGGLPTINISGLGGIGVAGYMPTVDTIKTLQLYDTVTKISGSHAFKMGYEFNNIGWNMLQPPYSRGFGTYSGQYSSIPNQNQNYTGVADALLVPTASTVGGAANVGGLSALQGSNYSASNDRRFYMGTFFQDDWKATPTFTLNLGVRWDLTTPYIETNGREANFVPTNGNGPGGTYIMPQKGCAQPRSSGFDALLQQDGIALQCVSSLVLGDTPYKNFAPRAGFAYRITPQAVIRGGYGIAYGSLANNGYGAGIDATYPFVYSLSFSSPNSVSPLTLAGGQTATIFNGIGTLGLTDPTQVAGNGLSLIGRQYNWKTPYTQTFNLTIQDQFTRNDSIQIGYVGALGRHLDTLGSTNAPSSIMAPGADIYANIPYPDFSPNSYYQQTNGASANNSLQATYTRQLSSGLSVLANYSYSKCMADGTQDSSGLSNRAQWLPGFGIRGDWQPCTWDATHVIHASGAYELPFGRGRQLLTNPNRLVDSIIGGWTANYLFTHQSGNPFTVGCPVSTTAFFGCNADLVAGQNPYGGPHNQKQWLNPAAFAQPPVASTTNASIAVLGGEGNQLRGPAYNNLDASVFKEFSIYEQARLQFRAEAFNLSNTAQFSNPNTLNFTNTSNFSEITTLRGKPRILQFALKLYY